MDDHKTLREKAEEYGDGKPICMKKELLKLRLEYIKKAEGIMKEKAIPLGSVAEMRKRRELDRMEEISPQSSLTQKDADEFSDKVSASASRKFLKLKK